LVNPSSKCRTPRLMKSPAPFRSPVLAMLAWVTRTSWVSFLRPLVDLPFAHLGTTIRPPRNYRNLFFLPDPPPARTVKNWRSNQLTPHPTGHPLGWRFSCLHWSLSKFQPVPAQVDWTLPLRSLLIFPLRAGPPRI